MMPEQVSDILKSKATLWVAPVATALPDETTVAVGAAWGSGWVKLGFTKEPLSVLYEFSEHEVMVEQVLGPLDRWKTDEHLTLETVLSEATALNLEYVTGLDGTETTSTAAGAAQKAFEALNVGNEPRLEKWLVGFEGIRYDAADNAQPVRLFLKGTININGALTFSQKDDDYTGIPVQVKAIADSSANG
jgi:hypothetical protein